MIWLNEPRSWAQNGNELVVRTDPKTDFWRITHDGAIRDSGHFFYDTVAGDFEVAVYLEGDFTDLYDQAGLMFRIDEKHWIKCGIEYFDGEPHRSVVVTRDYSDWSIMPQPGSNRLWIRSERRGDTVEISMSGDGESYTVFRQAYFSGNDSVQVGFMAASPAGDGFEARFRDYLLT